MQHWDILWKYFSIDELRYNIRAKFRFHCLWKEAYLQLPLLKEHIKSTPLGCTAIATGSPSSASNTKVAWKIKQTKSLLNQRPIQTLLPLSKTETQRCRYFSITKLEHNNCSPTNPLQDKTIVYQLKPKGSAQNEWCFISYTSPTLSIVYTHIHTQIQYI